MSRAKPWLRPLSAVRLALMALSTLLLSAQALAFCPTRTCEDSPSHLCERSARDCIVEGVLPYHPSTCISFVVARGGADELGLSSEELRSSVVQAFSRWEKADCGEGQRPGFQFSGGVLVDNSDVTLCQPELKDANVWSLATRWSGDGNVLGNTDALFDLETAQLVDVDVQINVPGLLAISTADERREALLAVLTHEAGHFLGLAHSNEPTALMAKSYAQTRLAGRQLTADDVEGICTLFPPAGEPERCSAIAAVSKADAQCGPSNAEAPAVDNWSVPPQCGVSRRSDSPDTRFAALCCCLILSFVVLRRFDTQTLHNR